MWVFLPRVVRWWPILRRLPNSTNSSVSSLPWVELMWDLLLPPSMGANTATSTQVSSCNTRRLSLCCIHIKTQVKCCFLYRMEPAWPGKKWKCQVLSAVHCIPRWQICGLLWGLWKLHRNQRRVCKHFFETFDWGLKSGHSFHLQERSKILCIPAFLLSGYWVKILLQEIWRLLSESVLSRERTNSFWRCVFVFIMSLTSPVKCVYHYLTFANLNIYVCSIWIFFNFFVDYEVKLTYGCILTHYTIIQIWSKNIKMKTINLTALKKHGKVYDDGELFTSLEVTFCFVFICVQFLLKHTVFYLL